MEQEPPRPPHTSLKDSRVNFRLGAGCLEAKVDYRADIVPKIPPPAPPTVPSLLPLLTQQPLLGDEEATAKCLRLLGNVPLQEQDTQKPPTIEYLSKEIESAQTHLEVFAWHSREYMVEHEEWEVCMTPMPRQSCLVSYSLAHRARRS